MSTIFNALVAQTDWSILVLRLALALIFLAHGWRKATHFHGTAIWMEQEVLKPGRFWAGLVTSVELLGGLALLLGFATQPAALILTVTMMGAFIYNFKAKKGFFQHLELDIILIATLLLLATLGSGMYGLDSYL